jgi:predicted nucleic acid-binding protein
LEIQRIISPVKRAKVSIYLRLRQGYHVATMETLTVANQIIRNFKLSPRDALHAASALLGEAQYFLSCDGVTKRFKTTPLSVNIQNGDFTPICRRRRFSIFPFLRRRQRNSQQ